MSLDIRISLLEKKESIDGLATNNLKIKLNGKNINYTIVNTIRRIILTLVPSYAYDPNDMIFEKNTSVFNNDYMRLRLSNIPIINNSYSAPIVKIDDSVLNKILDLERDALSEMDAKKIISKEVEEKKAKRKLEIVENLNMHISAKNDNKYGMILPVTTNDTNTKYYIKGKEIKPIYPRPILLIKLKPEQPKSIDGVIPGEEFKCTCIASLNIPLKSMIYSSCAICTYEEISDNEFHFELESIRQISEEMILTLACKIIILKLNQIQEKIIKAIGNNDHAKTEAELIIESENHTMGNLLTRVIQDQPDIEFAGCKVDHLCVNELTIRYKTNGTEFITILKRSVSYLISLYEIIIKQIEKL